MVSCERSNAWIRLKTGIKTLKFWRWGIQAMICVALTAPLVTIPAINELFEHSAVWAVQSCLVVLETTTGASVKKSLERVVGTVVGGLTAYAYLEVTIGTDSKLSPIVVNIVILLFIILVPFFWQWIRLNFPKNMVVGTYGILTTYLIVVSFYLGYSAFKMAILRIVAVVFGVLVNIIVVHLVLPNSARMLLKETMVNVFNSIAEMLEPLLELEAGLEATADFVTPRRIVLRDFAYQRHKLLELRYKYEQKRKHKIQRHTNNESLKVIEEKVCLTSISSMPNTDDDVENSRDIINSQNKKNRNDSMLPSLFTNGTQNPFLIHNSDSINSRSNHILETGQFSDIPSGLIHELSIANSDLSLGSAYFKEQEIRLENLKGEALKKLVSEYAAELAQAEAQREDRWKQNLKTFEKCQHLLGSLNHLILEAKQEVHFGEILRTFPAKQYSALFSHLQKLFHNIASLVFSIDVQLAQVSRAKRDSFLEFASGKETTVEDPETARRIFAGIAGAFLITEVFGSLVGQAASNIREALYKFGHSLNTGSDTNSAFESIEAAAEDIWVLCSMRNERSKVYADIFASGLRADMKGEWTNKRHGTSTNNTNSQSVGPSIPWEKLMGFDATTLRFMSKAEYEAFWESYWRARDRLSIVTGTLMLLRDQLYIVRTLVDRIINLKEQEYI